MPLTPVGLAKCGAEKVMNSQSEASTEKKKHGKRNVAGVLGVVSLILATYSSCHSEASDSIKKPGVAELDYVRLTKATFSDAEFGGIVKGVEVKRNEHTSYTPSFTDRTYTLSLTPGVNCQVNVKLAALLNKNITKGKDGKFHIPINGNNTKDSDIDLTCKITNPADVNAHGDSNMMGKITGGLAGVVNILPEVNLDNPVNRAAPMIGIGELQAIHNFATTCSKPAMRILTDTKNPDNIQNDIKQNLFNSAYAQIKKLHPNVSSPSDTTLSPGNFVLDFNISDDGLYEKYTPTLKQVESDVHGLSFPGGAQLPPCQTSHVKGNN